MGNFINFFDIIIYDFVWTIILVYFPTSPLKSPLFRLFIKE